MDATTKTQPSFVRPGDFDPEPPAADQSRRQELPPAETKNPPSTVRPGDFDPEPKPRIKIERYSPQKDDQSASAFTGDDLLPDKPEQPETSRSVWFGLGAWLVVWLVLLWLGFKIGGVVRFSLELRTPFRELACLAEAVLLGLTVVWLFRFIRALALRKPRQWKKADLEDPRGTGLVDYYAGIVKNEVLLARFQAQFPITVSGKDENAFSKATALSALENLSKFDGGKKKKWKEDQKSFDKTIVVRAKQIVNDHAILVGIKTATSPWKIVDILAVFYNSTRMIERIASLYGQACSGMKVFRLVCSWVFNLYVAGQLGEITERGTTSVVKTAFSALSSEKDDPSPWVINVLPVAQKALAKVGEGTVNYLFCHRLGVRAIEYFRPIPE